MIEADHRSTFGMTCVQCDNELIAPNGPSIGVSIKIVTFGAVGNATAVLKPSSTQSRWKITHQGTRFFRRG